MTEYDNTNRFSLFRNDKRRNDKDAEFTGSGNLDGVEFWINGWVKEKKDGSGKFFSGSLKRKDAPKIERQSAQTQTSRLSMADQLNDEVPFEFEWR